jgi:hypothetical protein
MFLFLSAFILGLLHSFEPDHLVAVSTIVARCKSAPQASVIGGLWGAGHTLVIIFVSLIIFCMKLSIPEQIFNLFEGCVGVMLIILGCRLINIFFNTIHISSRAIHGHDHGTSENSILSLCVGSVHGLAGSGAVIVLFFSQLASATTAFGSLGAFGFGTIVSMACASFFLGTSLHWYRSGSMRYFEKYLQASIGLVSIVFGVYKIITIAL